MAMSFGEALTAIESGGAADAGRIIAAIKGEQEKWLTEKKATTDKLTAARDALAVAAGAKPDDTFEKIAADLLAANKTIVAELEAGKTKITELETAAAAAARAASLTSAAAGLGLDSEQSKALTRLIGEAAVTVENGTTKIGGTPIEDWLKTDENRPFLPAIGRQSDGTPIKSPLPGPTQIPSGPPKTDGTPLSAYDLVITQKYAKTAAKTAAT